jgi:hypothetical protein
MSSITKSPTQIIPAGHVIAIETPSGRKKVASTFAYFIVALGSSRDAEDAVAQQALPGQIVRYGGEAHPSSVKVLGIKDGDVRMIRPTEDAP